MSVQPIAPQPRPPLPIRMSARRMRLDPPNTFQAPHHVILREPTRPHWIQSADPALAPLPVARLAEAPMRPTRPLRWKAAVAASVACHLAVAGFFLVRGEDEGVLIAGAQDAGIAMFGNAEADDSMAGEVEATNVTIVTMTTAQPVETVQAAEVATGQPVEAVEPVTEAVAASEVEIVQPVEETAVARPDPVDVVPREAATVQAPERAAASVAETPPAPAAETAPSDIVPEILAVDTADIVPEEEAVAPVATSSAEPAPVERVEEAKPGPATAEPVERVAEETPRSATQETAEPAVAAQPPREVVEAEPEPEPMPPIPMPSPRRVAEAEPPAAKKPPPAKKAAAKPVEKKAAAAPAKKAEKAAKAGSGGKGGSDARRGAADGEAGGTRARKAGKGNGSTAGNAAVTNYPGKVRGKVSRAASRISRRDRARADRDVTVSFTVTAAGGLGGVSVARSSGSPPLDQAAVAAVRRAAPFPPIPEGAGRRTWQFTIPMGLAR